MNADTQDGILRFATYLSWSFRLQDIEYVYTIIDSRMILAQQTGVGRYLSGLADGFSQLSASDRYEFWIQTGLPKDHPIKKLPGSHVAVSELPLRHMDLRALWQTPVETLRRKPDLLHYPHFDLPWTVPGPIAATIHDLKYIAQPDFFPRIRNIKRLAMYIMMVYTAHRSKRVIAVSEKTKSDIHRFLKIPHEKISVVPHGVASRFFREANSNDKLLLKQRYGFEIPYILFVGERRPHKNLATLIKAFSIFKTMVSQPYQLVIAGRPYSDYMEPEKLVEKLDILDSVKFLDYVPDDDLPSLYHSADAFISLSYYEGFGLPALEAMASQTPVIVSDNTSFPEVVDNAGITIPPDQIEQAVEALLQVIPGGEKREEYISRGIQRARTFTWLKCAEKTRSVYQQVAAK